MRTPLLQLRTRHAEYLNVVTHPQLAPFRQQLKEHVANNAGHLLAQQVEAIADPQRHGKVAKRSLRAG